jgi:hypothetical protein
MLCTVEKAWLQKCDKMCLPSTWSTADWLLSVSELEEILLMVVEILLLSLTVELLASRVTFCGGSEGTSDSVLHTTSSVLEPGPF